MAAAVELFLVIIWVAIDLLEGLIGFLKASEVPKDLRKGNLERHR
jgi:hypothetical protein